MVDANSLYGTTLQGGADGYEQNGFGYGAIFEITARGNEKVIHSFSGAPDGVTPSGTLARDSAGVLYGTTREGGDCGKFTGECGTVFKLESNGKESVLYTFRAGTKDAENPASGVIMDSAGNFYGAAGGGAYDRGAIFDVNTNGQEKVVYSFGKKSTDGVYPFGPLLLDGAGTLYGVTQEGSGCTDNPGGTVFKIDAAGRETTLYSFCNFAITGSTPSGPLVRDKAGDLYGLTGQGGDLDCPSGDGSGCGTIFKISSNGEFSVLHAFRGGSNDGAGSGGIGQGGGLGLIQNSAGDLYGITPNGGTNNYGTVFEIMGAHSSGYKVLHIFNGGDKDGANPDAPLLLVSGSLYGTTSAGGASGKGTVFQLKR
jgi:uncharacterized repeat protein (TIGR03803 family)